MKTMVCRKVVLGSLGFVLAGTPGFCQTKAPVKWTNPNPGATSRRSILDEVNFETDTSVVATGFPTLACAAEAAKRDGSIYYVIEGYADGRGSATHNLRLTHARAKAVADYLVFLGVPADRLQVVGMGKAGVSSDKITNFVNRKAIVIPRRGGFEGELIEKLPIEGLPCSTQVTMKVPGQLPMAGAQIEVNGQTFVISVNYGKIRSDLRNEIRRALAEDRAKRPAVEAPSAESKTEAMGAQAVEEKAAKASAAEAKASSDHAENHSENHGMLEIFGTKTNLKTTEKNLGSMAGGYQLSFSDRGAVQLGFQGEFGSYRRKLQGDMAFVFSGGPFRGAAFVSYVSMSGVPLDGPKPANLIATMGGARLGLEWPTFGFGVTYVSASTPGTVDPIYPQDPVSVVQGDLRYSGERVEARLWGGSARKQDRNSLDLLLQGKTIGGLELSCRVTEGVAIVAKGESLPIYDAYSYQGKAETRVSLGLRFGSSRGSSMWVRVPSARTVFPL